MSSEPLTHFEKCQRAEVERDIEFRSHGLKPTHGFSCLGSVNFSATDANKILKMLRRLKRLERKTTHAT